MARSGDWITPRLEGQPWFEKPPLVYWTTAAMNRLGFRDEWAARLPIALASLAFLWFFYGVVEREYSERVAAAATAILATSAGWIAYSSAGVMDLPLTATLGSAMLLTLFDTRPNRGFGGGVLLGLAILAKGLVPVALFFPVWLIARKRRMAILGSALMVALPWYVACLWKYGSVFWNEFFWKHHVARLYSPSIQHVEPFWFYIPVLLAGLFPWTPLFGLVGRAKLYDDFRVRFLAGWAAVFFVGFSLVVNKLPGYLMPLLPAVAIVLAVAIDRAKSAEYWVAGCALLLGALPVVGAVIPQAFRGGLTRTPVPWSMLGWSVLPAVAVAGVVWWLGHSDRVPLAIMLTALAASVGAADLKVRILPVLDSTATVRPFWREHRAEVASAACVDSWVNRGVVYGLEYYGERVLNTCPEHFDAQPRVTAREGTVFVSEAK